MPLGWSDLEDFLPTCLKLELKETKRGEANKRPSYLDSVLPAFGFRLVHQ